MTQRKRMVLLIISSGYTIAACSQEADRITILFYRADHIYQLECYAGEWDCIVLWGAAHDDSWDDSKIGKSEGVFVPLAMCSLDRYLIPIYKITYLKRYQSVMQPKLKIILFVQVQARF